MRHRSHCCVLIGQGHEHCSHIDVLIVTLGQYLLSNRDSLMQVVTKQHKEDLPQNVSIIKMARNYADDLLEDETLPLQLQSTQEQRGLP